MSIIAIAPNDPLIEKLKSNIQEVRARGGELYVIADAGTEKVEGEGVHILNMPENYGLLSPVLHVMPSQLRAYHAAPMKGVDMDNPQNPAKSVSYVCRLHPRLHRQSLQVLAVLDRPFGLAE